MKKIYNKFLVLGLFVVLCSAFMSLGPVVSDAYAEGFNASVSEGGSKATNDTSGATVSVGSGLNLGGSCSGYKSDPFKLIACKAMTTLADLRVLIYIISGFGLIAFTFAAIFGKISWKHLSQLAFSLFLVSMMAPFIEYFTGGTKAYNLNYNNYLPSSYDVLFSSSDGSLNKTDCGSNCQEEVIADGLSNDPLASENLKDSVDKETAGDESNESASTSGDDTQTASGDSANSQEKNKTSWKDLANAGKSTADSIRAANNIVQSAKNANNEISQQRDNIKNALSGLTGGGVKGAISNIGTIIDAGNRIADAGYRLDKSVERNTETIKDGADTLSGLGGNK